MVNTGNNMPSLTQKREHNLPIVLSYNLRSLIVAFVFTSTWLGMNIYSERTEIVSVSNETLDASGRRIFPTGYDIVHYGPGWPLHAYSPNGTVTEPYEASQGSALDKFLKENCDWRQKIWALLIGFCLNLIILFCAIYITCAILNKIFVRKKSVAVGPQT